MEAKEPKSHSPPEEKKEEKKLEFGDVMEMAEKVKEKPLKFSLTWFAIAVGVGLALWFLIPTPEGLTDRGHKFLALLVTVIILWVTEAVPVGITALVVGVGLAAFDIQPVAKAWQTYAHQAVVFVFTIIMLGIVLGQTTIPERLMNLILRLGGRKTMKLSFTLCMGATFFAVWTHDAAITVILLFAVLPMILKMGITPDKSNLFAKHWMFIIPLGAACGGGGSLIGSARSPVSVEMLHMMTGYTVGFMEYIWYQFPPSMVYGLCTWLAVWLVFPPKINGKIPKELPAEVKITPQPPLTPKEKGLIAVIGLTLLAWFLGDVHKLHLSIPGASFLIITMLFGLVSWRRCLLEFPWNPMMVFGAGFSLGVAMLDTGAGKWIAEQVFPIIAGAAWPIVIYGVGWLSAVITSFMANAAATALLCPVVGPMADLAGTPVMPVIMTVPLATTFVLLVIGCPPTLIAYGFGYFTQWEAFKVFVGRTFICLLITTLFAAVWYPIAGMPGNIDMMATPAKLKFWGYELLPK